MLAEKKRGVAAPPFVGNKINGSISVDDLAAEKGGFLPSRSEDCLASLDALKFLDASVHSGIISRLRRQCYSSLLDEVEWKVPRGYDYGLSSAENYRVDAPEKQIHLGIYKDIRRELDTEYHGFYTPERQWFQDKLVKSVLQTGESVDHPWIIFTAGPMGAGKSHTLEWMNEKGYFPLENIVQLDPDKFKLALPEWGKYVEHDRLTAGFLTQKESGLLVEIGQEAALRCNKNIWIDGSFRDYDWYRQVFAHIRRENSHYRIAILYVHATREVVMERVRMRAEKTGRYVREQDVNDSLKRVPLAVYELASEADFVADIDNSGSVPRLAGWSAEDGSSHLNVCGTFEEITKRFSSIPKDRSQATWHRLLNESIEQDKLVAFGKSYCDQSQKLAQLLEDQGADSVMINLDEDSQSGPGLGHALEEMTGSGKLPLLFVNGKYVGGYGKIKKLQEEGSLGDLIDPELRVTA
uniref:Zeta toxin domain-containing protein n=1 Tax=Rhodosorus marinus TaxID=101924 RepID=A0A7S0G7Z0_9RHOD|mmetsp:Transcript_5154/g.7138  ORF Transcript_5154/g.7138 Transcript_5154/m.7138 type:complete len:466 (+) Transcript_5154:57-1454(+)